MFFKKRQHADNLYNILLTLSRNKFFYKKMSLSDSFETRIYLMFFHFCILMKVFKKKDKKFNQNLYDLLFHKIENNLRELGFGDVSVNKKMKDLNKILYDILLKIEKEEKKKESFQINQSLITKYFEELNSGKIEELWLLNDYFLKFFNFCFELPLEYVIRDSIKFKY